MKDINVPEGYKSTDVGVIPEDWKVNNLNHIAEIIMGQSPIGNSYNKNGKGIALINGPTEFTKKHPIKIQWTTSPTKLCKSGDILLCIRGSSTGRINVANDNYCIGRGITAIRARETSDNLFLEFMVQNAVKSLLALSAGSTFPNLDSKSLRTIQIASPPLPEQKAIARVLSDVDELIRECDSLIAKKRDIKQGTMQLLLTGKKRLPGFSGEWEMKRLEEVADNRIKWSISGGPFGSNLKSSDYTTDGVRIVQLQNIGDGIFYDNYKIYTSEKKANELISCNIYSGEIILSKMGDPVARACFIPGLNQRYLMCSDGIRLVINKSRFNKKFVHDYINSKYFRNKAIDSSTGSTRMRIGLQELKKLTIIAPPLPEQKAIAQILSDMDAEIEALEKKRDKYKAIKQGMMQELLTGKTRLIDN